MSSQKHHIAKIDGFWCSITDIKNDKLGGPHKNVHITARSITDNLEKKRHVQDAYILQVMIINQQPDILWIDRKDKDEIFAMGKNGEELLADATHDVNESNVIFIWDQNKLLALNSKFIHKN